MCLNFFYCCPVFLNRNIYYLWNPKDDPIFDPNLIPLILIATTCYMHVRVENIVQKKILAGSKFLSLKSAELLAHLY
jgi:hypothetical protein